MEQVKMKLAQASGMAIAAALLSPAAMGQEAPATDGGLEEIMGVKHKSLPIEGVQFHPESILTRCGHDLLKNFINTTNQVTHQAITQA